MSRRAATVEIQGTWLENTGARQMLEAAVHRLRAEVPDIAVALDPRWGASTDRSTLGLLDIVPRGMPGERMLERGIGVVHGIAPRRVDRLLTRRALVTRREIDALLDCSGFALSDQWGPKKAKQRWDMVRRYTDRGRPVILLPQAMGPFDDEETAAAARRILLAADLVWVRDERSYEHAVALGGPEATVRLAPDITLLEAGEPPDVGAADVVLVPNGRMTDRGGWSRAAYLTALVDAGAAARAAGRTLEILLHTDEHADETLGRTLARELACPLVSETRPARIKGRLGAAELVIASRFHALLGALSQGVPALSIGWSHKYDELYRDFDCDELALEDSDGTVLQSTTTELLRDARDVRRRIAARVPVLRAAVEQMWLESLPVLGLDRRVAV